MSILGNAATSIGGMLGASPSQPIQNAYPATPARSYLDPYTVETQEHVYYPTKDELRLQIKPVENGYLVIVTTGKSVSTYIAAEFKDVHDIIDLAAVKNKLNASS